MKFFSVQRNSQLERRFHPNMGHLLTRVTRIQQTILGIPYRTLYRYRETYYGEVKDCEECRVARL
ncbi:MAG: hypothetical protein NWR72_09200 [Bacteroidia bacterium]|nr:hypothetical protein [Bacteroidia bacterium]